MAMSPGNRQVAAALAGRQAPFVWGSNGERMTAEQLKKHRAVTEALLARNNRTPTNLGEGLASMGNALAFVARQSREDEAQRLGRDSYSEAFGALGDNPGYDALLAAAPNGFETEAERMVWQSRMAEAVKGPDWQTREIGGDLVRWDASDPNGEASVFYDGPATADASSALGTTIHLGRDADGKIVPMQVGQQGFVPSALPEGVVSYDPGAAAGARTDATFDSKAASAARAALPGAEQTLMITRDAINTLRNDKQGQEEQFGGLNRTFGSTPGTAMANFQVNLAQAGGQAFMQARNMLKGGGQITDYEGRRAEVAFSRLTEAAERGDMKTFNAALDDFEEAVEMGFQKLKAAAAGDYSKGGAAFAPGSGADLKTKYGLE